METAYEQLREQVTRVANARRGRDAAHATLSERRARFEAENAELIAGLRQWEADVEHAEHALRTLTVSHFEVTGEAKPTPGVEVKTFRTLDYDERDAFDWSSEKGMCIKPASLDKKSFEKVVGALPILPDFVREVVTPRAQIATNLDKVVGATVEAA